MKKYYLSGAAAPSRKRDRKGYTIELPLKSSTHAKRLPGVHDLKALIANCAN